MQSPAMLSDVMMMSLERPCFFLPNTVSNLLAIQVVDCVWFASHCVIRCLSAETFLDMKLHGNFCTQGDEHVPGT